MIHEINAHDLERIHGGRSADYPYLEQQFGTMFGLAFLAGAVGSGLALAGAFAVGGLMLFDDLYNNYY
jgi:hypothetical protein